MALTRKMCKALGIEEDKIDQIIEAHAETVDALKEERDSYKAKAEESADVVKERDDLKQQLEKVKAENAETINGLNAQIEKLTKAGGDAAKVQADFDAYKKQVEDEKTNGEKNNALDEIIKGVGITNEAARKLILKGYDLNSVVLEDGKVTNKADIEKAIKADYKDFISTTQLQGTPSVTPPSGGSSMTKDQILAIRDGAERRKAIADHPELFGLQKE